MGWNLEAREIKEKSIYGNNVFKRELKYKLYELKKSLLNYRN